MTETVDGWKVDASGSVNATRYEWYVDNKLLSGVYGPQFEIEADDYAEGTHTLKLTVTSNTNNTHSFDDEFVVVFEKAGGEDNTDWMTIGCVAAVIIIAVLAIVLWRRGL